MISFNAATLTFGAGSTSPLVAAQANTTYLVRTRCSDEVNSVFGLFILNINDIPQVSNPIPTQTLIVGTAMNYTLPANVFSDFSNLTITSSATPAGITFDPLTRSFSGTPTTAGTTTITLTGTDGNGASNTTTFDFVV